MDQEAESLPSSGGCNLPMPFASAIAKRPLESALPSSELPKRLRTVAEANSSRSAASSLPNSILPRIRTSQPALTLLRSSSSVDSDISVCLDGIVPQAQDAGSRRPPSFFAEDAGRKESPHHAASSIFCQTPSGLPSARPDEPCTPRATSLSTSIFTPTHRLQPQSAPSSPYVGHHSSWHADGRGVRQQTSNGSGARTPTAGTPLLSPTSSQGVPDRMMTGRTRLLSPQAPLPRHLLFPRDLRVLPPTIQNPNTSASNPLPWANLAPGLSLHIPSSAPKPLASLPAPVLTSPLPSASISSLHTPSPTPAAGSLSPGVWTLGKVGLSHQPPPSPMALGSGASNSPALGSCCSAVGQKLAPSRFAKVQIRREAQLGFVLAACAPASHQGKGDDSPTASDKAKEEDPKKVYRESVKRAFSQWLNSVSKAPGSPSA